MLIGSIYFCFIEKVVFQILRMANYLLMKEMDIQYSTLRICCLSLGKYQCFHDIKLSYIPRDSSYYSVLSVLFVLDLNEERILFILFGETVCRNIDLYKYKKVKKEQRIL